MNWKALLGDAAPILGTVLGGPAGTAIGGLVAKVLGVGDTKDQLETALKTNPALLAKIKALEITQGTQLAILSASLQKGQMAIDQTEAQSKSLFIAGWRPFVGWACGIALALSAGLIPIVEAVSAAVGYMPPHGWPAINLSAMTTILLALLGFGGMRSAEKLKGKANGV